MNWFNFDFRKLIRIALALSLPFLSIQVQRRPAPNDTWFDQPFSFLASSIEGAIFGFADEVRGTTLLYLNLINIKRENQIFASENLYLRTQIQLMAEMKRESERLHSLLGFQQKSKMTMVPAQIIANDLMSSDHSALKINKGSQHGIKPGLAVITTAGALGHTFRVEAFTSYVLLLTDRYTVVDGIVARSRARGLVEGQGGSEARFMYVEKSEDVKPGDLIVTSGLDNIFPKGFPIATVERVENQSYTVSLDVFLRPSVDPDQVEEVFIVTNAGFEDYMPDLQLPTEEPAKAQEVGGVTQ